MQKQEYAVDWQLPARDPRPRHRTQRGTPAAYPAGFHRVLSPGSFALRTGERHAGPPSGGAEAIGGIKGSFDCQAGRNAASLRLAAGGVETFCGAEFRRNNTTHAEHVPNSRIRLWN